MKVISSVISEKSKDIYKVESEHFKFNGLFKLLEILKTNMIIEKRYQCLIENLLERRSENWVESILVDAGPKTLSQIF